MFGVGFAGGRVGGCCYCCCTAIDVDAVAPDARAAAAGQAGAVAAACEAFVVEPAALFALGGAEDAAKGAECTALAQRRLVGDHALHDDVAFGEESPFVADGAGFAGADFGVEELDGLPVGFLFLLAVGVGQHGGIVDGAFVGAFLAPPVLDHRGVAHGSVGDFEGFGFQADLEAEGALAESEEVLVRG